MKVNKIPLQSFISTLVSKYNRGVEYVDLSLIIGEKQDSIGIEFTKEYMSAEAAALLEQEDIENNLDEDKINQLI